MLFELFLTLQLQDRSQHPARWQIEETFSDVPQGSGSATGRDTEVECKLVPTNRLEKLSSAIFPWISENPMTFPHFIKPQTWLQVVALW